MDWTSTLPPMVVLALALLTRRVIFSLLAGFVIAALLANQFDLLKAGIDLLQSIGRTLDYENLSRGIFSPASNWSIFIFIASLGIVIALLEKSGATTAFTRSIEKRVKSAKDVQKVSLALSMLFFIDDYFSSLSIGRLMIPLTDRFKIARAKLAFLIDSMASPLAVLCPFSSWVGVIIGFLLNNGVSEDLSTAPLLAMSPFWVFLLMIPFIYYSFIIMGTSWYVVLRGIRFGLMKKFEIDAEQKTLTPSAAQVGEAGRILDFFVVWFLLVGSLLGALLYHGGWGAHSFLEAFQKSDIKLALFSCSIITLLGSIAYFLGTRTFRLQDLFSLAKKGILMMKSSLMILVIAWSMGLILKEELKVGEFIAHLFLADLGMEFLPLAVFITALTTSFAIGSSWGTAALLFPMVIPTLFASAHGETLTDLATLPYFLPTLGALLSGAVAGDHISPISDTTIMTSLSTDMPHIDHVTTQFGYAFLPIAATALGYGLFIVLADSIPIWGQCILSLGSSFLFLIIGLEVAAYSHKIFVISWNRSAKQS